MGNRALLVGINAYRGAPLRGCVNDVHDMANLLIDRYGFKSNEIRLLVDKRATTRNIIKRLKWLTGCKPGDKVLFHFSGHGTQYPTRNHRAEVDGLLECLCPIDFAWVPKRMITDKTLVSIFKRIPKGVRFNWVADCCHSGDLTRSIGVEQTSKMFPVPLDIAWRKRCADESKIYSGTRHMIKNVLDVGFVSGCKSNQTSADAIIKGRPCGALTHFLIKNLRKRDKKLPLKRIVKMTRNELAAKRYSQRPQAEGARVNRPFLR